MARCNELCTKDATGTCALCEALAERDRFIQFWFKGKLLIDGIRVLKEREVLAFLQRHGFLLLGGLVFLLIPYISYISPLNLPWRLYTIGTLLLIIIFLLLWKFPQWHVSTISELKDRIDLSWKVRQTLMQSLSAVAVIGGLYYTAGTYRMAEEKARTDQFTKAVEYLESDHFNLRIMGIYTLERIARYSVQDYTTVMGMLINSLRQWTAVRKSIDTASTIRSKEEASELTEPRPDIQALLTVLARRTRTYGSEETEPLNLRRLQLQSFNLSSANFQGADLTEASLQDAYLRDANLQGAFLEQVQLQGANLQRANLQDAQLMGANLQGAQLQDANLQGAFLGRAQLQGAQLMGANLQSADLWQAQLQGARLIAVKNLTQDQINAACTAKHTILPKGLTRPNPCSANP